MRSLKHFHTPLTDDTDLVTNDNRKDELLKMMVCALDEMGYKLSAEKLAQESNVKLEKDFLKIFETQIIEGDWDNAFHTLRESELPDDKKKRFNYLLNETKYIELILQQKYNDGLLLLRSELVPNCPQNERLRTLASILMCSNQQEIEEKLETKINVLELRKKLVLIIYEEIGSKYLSPAGRFNKIIQQALSFQELSCKYHLNPDENSGILEDHICQPGAYPSKPYLGFLEHSDEISLVKFSNKGNMFVTITKGCEMCIWEFNSHSAAPKLKQRITKIHNKEVNNVTWCPNDQKILTASSDKTVRIWSVETGHLLLTLHSHLEVVRSVLWIPGTSHFISGGLDNFIVVWNTRGEEVNRINSPKIAELMVSSDGKRLFMVCAASPKIAIIDLLLQAEIDQVREKHTITTAALSNDDKFLLTHVSGVISELHLWNLEKSQIVQIFDLHSNPNTRLGISIGGASNEYIACGSEDGTIKVWHRNHTDPVVVLQNHNSTVNSLSWHPNNPQMFISASDDKTLCIWVSEYLLNRAKNGLSVNLSQDLVKVEENLTLCENLICEFEEEV